jgi:dihydroorotate dehydrogenase (NAD+) catalytic subunit
MSDINLEVNIGKLKLKNPIMPASGTFGHEMKSILDFEKIGAIVPKSITKYPRPGNSRPRVCEVRGGMINSIGIQSKGLEYYKNTLLPEYEEFNTPIIASISADSIDEFVEMSVEIGNIESVKALELNISCPNLENDGKAFGMEADTSFELIQKIKDNIEIPVIPKLTPNVTSIQEIAIACEEAGADGLNVANTLLAMSIDINSRKPKIGNIMGGLSGPLIKPVIIRMIYQTSQVTNIPIIGCGGVMNGEDAIEMLLAGANAVQVGTANFINPKAMLDTISELEEYMVKNNIFDVRDLIGKVEIDRERINQI